MSKRWVKIALINLFIVALLGATMRYKIGFKLPFLEQKFLKEAHSHFAFTGWITHVLFFLLVDLFRKGLPSIREKTYHRLIIVNLLSAYGMLVSFLYQGYGPVSLTFSTISVLTAYAFSWFGLKDAARLENNHPGKNWIKVALWFGVLSTIGTMVLSWMMATRNYDQTTYLGSVYFYLHFQYNGWFLFACFAILVTRIREIIPDMKDINTAFRLLAGSAIPAYFLSTLWANLPVWLFVLVIIASIAQVVGWWFFMRVIRKNLAALKTIFDKTAMLLLLAVSLAFTLKILLQLGSTIPAVAKLAYSFRPIIIAYMHLVLLLIISVFLLTFLYGTGYLRLSKATRWVLPAFVIAVILNELVLAVQGIYSFSYTVVPYANEVLFGISVALLGSAGVLAATQLRKP